MSENATVSHDTPHPHVLPAKLLLGTGFALMALTVITVAVTWVDLGSMNLVVAMVIASVKALLVALIFMHLLWDKPLNAFLLVAAIGFVALFVLLATLDTLEYKPQVIPDYAPKIHR